MNELDVEELRKKYREALAQIHWLEQEVLRLKLLLEGDNSMSNSLPTAKPIED